MYIPSLKENSKGINKYRIKYQKEMIMRSQRGDGGGGGGGVQGGEGVVKRPPEGY